MSGIGVKPYVLILKNKTNLSLYLYAISGILISISFDIIITIEAFTRIGLIGAAITIFLAQFPQLFALASGIIVDTLGRESLHLSIFRFIRAVALLFILYVNDLFYLLILYALNIISGYMSIPPYNALVRLIFNEENKIRYFTALRMSTSVIVSAIIAPLIGLAKASGGVELFVLFISFIAFCSALLPLFINLKGRNISKIKKIYIKEGIITILKIPILISILIFYIITAFFSMGVLVYWILAQYYEFSVIYGIFIGAMSVFEAIGYAVSPLIKIRSIYTYILLILSLPITGLLVGIIALIIKEPIIALGTVFSIMFLETVIYSIIDVRFRSMVISISPYEYVGIVTSTISLLPQLFRTVGTFLWAYLGTLFLPPYIIIIFMIVEIMVMCIYIYRSFYIIDKRQILDS